MTKLDLTKNPAAQDMVKIIMEKKEMSAEDAVRYSVNSDISEQIIETGWASIALPIWGHDDPEREWKVLDNPIIKVDFDEQQQRLINGVIEKENVKTKTAIFYFLLFTMQSLGYHI